MKRKLFIAGATFVLVAAAVTAIAANRQTNKPTLLEANIEALGANGPDSESDGGGGGRPPKPQGRWRTVGCASVAMENWRTYCCPNEYYNNCPNSGTCSGNPIGC